MTDPAAANPDLHVLEHLLAVLRRRWKTILLFIVLGLAAGFLYAESQPPQYATSATILVRSGFAADPVRPGIQTSTPEEEGQFLSQLEYIKSASVAAAVADKLDLTRDAAFAKAAPAGYRRLLARFEQLSKLKTGLVPQAEAVSLDRDAVIGRLQANVRALRAGRTYVAAISYTHSDPAVAQKVAQAFAEAFRDVLAKASQATDERVKAAVEAEIAQASPEARPALEARYRETVISRAVPGVDAVIISDARLPGAPIAPRKSFLIAVGIILGAALGCLLAGWREMRDRGLRDGDRLARRLGTRFLGYVPKTSIDQGRGSTTGTGLTLPSGAKQSVSEPYTGFSEAVRAAAVAAMAGSIPGEARFIGIASLVDGEGRTAFAANLASHLGNQGLRVLLIDGDFRQSQLTDWLTPAAQLGTIDTLLQNKPLAETAFFDARSNVTFLATAQNGRGIDPAGLLGGARMQAFIAEQRGHHDVIVIDLPPLAVASADAVAVEPVVDAYVLLAGWGAASPAFIEATLQNLPSISAKLTGLVVTGTDLRKLPLYVRDAAGSVPAKRKG